jgi:hypothetical protein
VYEGRDFRPFGGYLNQYAGGFAPANWSWAYSAQDFIAAGTTDSQVGPEYESAASYGPAAWNRFRPKAQRFDAMQFLFDDLKDLPTQVATTAELMRDSYQGFLAGPARDLFTSRQRSLARDRVLMPGAILNQYLNYEFGWAPFIGDLKKLYHAYSVYNRSIAQLHRDNSRWIKRGGTVLSVRETSDVTTVEDFAGLVYPALTSDFFSGHGDGYHVRSKLYTYTQRDVWFSGEFKYHVPAYDVDPSKADAYEVMGQMLHYYGVGVTPNVVWELTPWTWLVDWFSNVGDNVANLSAMFADQLVSREAYVMCHAKKLAVNDSTIFLRDGDVKCLWYQEIETKKRTMANPYGFGLSFDDLSERQLAILTALFGTRAGYPRKGLTGGPS